MWSFWATPRSEASLRADAQCSTGTASKPRRGHQCDRMQMRTPRGGASTRGELGICPTPHVPHKRRKAILTRFISFHLNKLISVCWGCKWAEKSPFPIRRDGIKCLGSTRGRLSPLDCPHRPGTEGTACASAWHRAVGVPQPLLSPSSPWVATRGFQLVKVLFRSST